MVFRCSAYLSSIITILKYYINKSSIENVLKKHHDSGMCEILNVKVLSEGNIQKTNKHKKIKCQMLTAGVMHAFWHEKW